MSISQILLTVAEVSLPAATGVRVSLTKKAISIAASDPATFELPTHTQVRVFLEFSNGAADEEITFNLDDLTIFLHQKDNQRTFITGTDICF